MNNNEIRCEIENIIQYQKVPKCNGNFQDAHMYYYDIFFSIFESLGSKYYSLEKKPKKIDFIESEGKLLEYYEIVKGNSDSVRKEYYTKLKAEGEKRYLEHIEHEIKQRRNDWFSTKKDVIEDKIMNSCADFTECSDYLKYVFNDDNIMHAFDIKAIQDKIRTQNLKD